MRFDKLTTKFQQALADAQGMASNHDNPYIESQHLLLALLQQEDGGTVSLLQRSGANVVPLRDALRKGIERLPKTLLGKSAYRAILVNCSTWLTRKLKNGVINLLHRKCFCWQCSMIRANLPCC